MQDPSSPPNTPPPPRTQHRTGRVPSCPILAWRYFCRQQSTTPRQPTTRSLDTLSPPYYICPVIGRPLLSLPRGLWGCFISVAYLQVQPLNCPIDWPQRFPVHARIDFKKC
ncbi:hypothetical protein PENSPDRAFT_656624 [Peniophora sp. CONT]|nr:hypothetical protein PENSPDRAFT_656624 [Peniophora sp. CONT]